MILHSIDAFLAGPAHPPFGGSVAITNAKVVDTLCKLGYRTRRFPTPRLFDSIPLDHADALVRLSADAPVDLALYDDEGLSARPPSRRWARRSAVICHGVMKNPGAWLGNVEIDLFVANSPYLADVLRSLLALPDWRHRRCLDARAFNIVTDIRLPLPCVDEEDGATTLAGASVPSEVLKLCDQGVVLGHCLQPTKINWFAALSIIFHLNERARKEGAAPVRLLVCKSDFGPRARAEIDATLDNSDFCRDEMFLPVPHLAQPALFTLMRSCRFGLSYNNFPEPFGFYVLESVHNGCPVYTNGIGNNRFLLPEGHGITVIEDPSMVLEPDSSAPYARVADTIFEDLANPEAVSARCVRGRGVIRATWSEGSFERSLADTLARIDDLSQAPADFESMVINPSPLVRHMDLKTGVVLSDRANQVLTEERRARVAEMLGQNCADLAVDSDSIEEMQALFREGILTLRPRADAPEPR